MFKNKAAIPLSEPVLEGNELVYVKHCIDTGWVSSAGGFVDKFEKGLCGYVKAKYAVACVNGTCGLHIALRLCGVGEGDEVIVPTLTFIAPVNAVRYVGAEPVFMDCDDYMNIDSEKVRLFCQEECRFTKRGLKNKRSGRMVKAVIPVHIFGNPCNMAAIMEIAEKYNLKVIEDATESIGSYYTQGIYRGKFTGTISDFGVYSFNGNKIITTGGGGMIITNDKNMAKKAKYLTNQAKDDPVTYMHNEIGYNFRLSNLQAAVGVAQLERLEVFIKIKKMNYAIYQKELEGIEGVGLLGIQEDTRPNYWFYSLIIDKKKYGMSNKELMRGLAREGIQTRPIWYLNHLQKPYLKNEAYKIKKAFWFWERVLNLPSSSNLTERQIKRVVYIIRKLKEVG